MLVYPRIVDFPIIVVMGFLLGFHFVYVLFLMQLLIIVCLFQVPTPGIALR